MSWNISSFINYGVLLGFTAMIEFKKIAITS